MQQQAPQEQQPNEEDEEESSASTKSSSVGTGSDNNDNEQQKIASIKPIAKQIQNVQIQQQPQQQQQANNPLSGAKQQILPQNVQNELQRRISKESLSNAQQPKVQKMDSKNKLNDIPQDKSVIASSVDYQYRFQPIRPPSTSVSVDHGNISISPIHSNGPSPAFNPQKLQNLANKVDFAQMPLKNPGMEGTSNSNVSLELAHSQQSLPKADIAAPAPAIDKQGSTIFGVLLKQKDKSNHLIRQVLSCQSFLLQVTTNVWG